MILSPKRYQKGNLVSQKRLSGFAAVPLKTRDILPGVTQLHISLGSLHRNRAKPRS
jgi:hypothetical protein